MKSWFRESYGRRIKQVREWYPRRIKENGGLSPEFVEAYRSQRKVLLGKGLNRESLDKWISKALTFEKFDD